jgi:hypothetical protein
MLFGTTHARFFHVAQGGLKKFAASRGSLGKERVLENPRRPRGPPHREETPEASFARRDGELKFAAAR